MTTPHTPLPLSAPPRPDEELQALCEAAKPGPWSIISTSVCRIYGPDAVERRQVFTPSLARVDHPDDAAFIAAARQAVPSLLARVVATEKKLAAVEAECDRIERMPSREPYNTLTGRGMALAATKIRAALAEGVTR